MKPQPHNRNKRISFGLNWTQMVLCIAGALVLLLAVFILGIVAGRGYFVDALERGLTDQVRTLQLNGKRGPGPLKDGKR